MSDREDWGAGTMPRSARTTSRSDHGHNAKVALFGEWGYGNLGDEAILEGAKEFLRSAGLQCVPFVLGSLLPHDGGYRNINDVVPRRPYRELPRRWARPALRPLRNRIRSRALQPMLRDCVAFVVGGGALLDDSRHHFTDSLSRVAQLSIDLAKPLICLGCGAVGPWSRRGQLYLGSFARSCDYIAVRDPMTAVMAAEVLGREVRVFGDFAMNLPQASSDPAGTQRGMRSLALNAALARGLSNAEQLGLELQLAEIAREWVSTDRARRITIFTTGVPGDRISAQRLAQRLAGLSPAVVVAASVPELQDILRTSDATVAVRLHAAILSLEVGTPFVGFAPGSKLSAYFGYLGLGGQVVSPQYSGAVAQVLSVLANASAGMPRLDTTALIEVREEVHRELRLLSVSPRDQA